MTEFPEKDLNLFLACNGANNWAMKQKFYNLKAIILTKHGSPDEYDIQILEKKCDRCEGKGCDVCINGIYSVNKIALKRYLINEYVFHIPVGRVSEKGNIELFGNENKMLKLIEHRLVFRNNIQGLVKHKPTNISNINYTFAFFVLSYKYDKNTFYDEIGDYSSRLFSKQKGKYRSALRNNDLMMDGLAEYFELSEKDKEQYNIDDMLFKSKDENKKKE